MLGGVNPWISMWAEPRSTIRAIVNTNPRIGILYLASLYVIQSFFYGFSFLHLTSHPYLSLFLAILLSPIAGMLWLYFAGSILYLTGRLLGGHAPRSYLLAAMAWSKIPMTISLLMWFVLLIASQGVELLYYPQGVSSVFIFLIAFISFFWSQVLLFQSIRELQGFSVARSLVNIIISLVVFDLIVFVIYFLIF